MEPIRPSLVGITTLERGNEVEAERLPYEQVKSVKRTMDHILILAEADGITTAAAAQRLAEARLSGKIQVIYSPQRRHIVSDQDHLDEPEWPELNPEVEASWNQNAGFWDDYMGAEGNDWHKLLIRPATERLLEIRPDEVVLDIACGNGNFSRYLAGLGARVVATDLSETMLARARTYSTEQAGRITYQVVDATDEAQLLALGQNRFDAAVSNMALMDMVTIEPLLAGLARVLKPGGRFVFSIMHPCFQAYNMTKIAEQEERDGEFVTRYAVKVSAYIKPVAFRGVAISGQPVLQHYFHRPLSLLFKSCFQAGFVVDGLEEPVFEAEPGGRNAFSWTKLNEIPPVLVVRLRLGSVTGDQ